MRDTSDFEIKTIVVLNRGPSLSKNNFSPAASWRAIHIANLDPARFQNRASVAQPGRP